MTQIRPFPDAGAFGLFEASECTVYAGRNG